MIAGSDAIKCYECLNCATPTRPMDCATNVTTCFKSDANGGGELHMSTCIRGRNNTCMAMCNVRGGLYFFLCFVFYMMMVVSLMSFVIVI